ncbi:hypothetical protein BC937DRAFT_90046 [Endogone sp. FLAS-F59071]|nr:hypothetical protein BC937DRAFT_90046 [Endogone sp. FLAS-F59071]|eukprot:RUS22190.1 hypothetical protein BC937DRAFT_90046 [Endogone sp. FLAS-F59071]
MSEYTPYTSYISSLNSLSPDNSPTISQEDLADELAHWTNAQFTFDMPPGMGIYNDDTFAISKLTQQQHSTSNLRSEGVGDTDEPVTYEGLAEYLDYELPQKQDQHQQITPIPQGVAVHSRSRHNSLSHAQPTTTILQPFVIAHTPVHATVPMLNTHIAPAPAPASTTPTATSFPAIVPATTTFLATPKSIKPPNGPLLLAKQSVPNVTHPYMTVSTLSAAAAPGKRRHGSIDPTMLASNPSPPPEQTGSPESDDDGSIELDAASKFAAEEDKRRRNTAASARFRIKKKQREQALERTAREMSEKAGALETRVRELEMEVKWLRGLIVEKDSRLLDITEGKTPKPGEEQPVKKAKVGGEEAK